MITVEYRVEFWNVKVNKYAFEFNYRVIKNGDVLKAGIISDEHIWGDSNEEIQNFKQQLTKSYAEQLILEKIYEF